MRIAKNELLAGIPVLKIRDYFRLLYSGLMTRDGLAERFNLNEKETEGLVGELLSKGYIEPADNGMYRLTLKGNALSIARCMAPINREKADRIMQEFLKRVEEVNRDDFYPYRVSKLVLFGSYLNPEQMDLGDIDIAFELEPKIKDYDELMRYNDQLVDKARKEGKSFSSLIDILGYSEKLVILKLRNKEKIHQSPPNDRRDLANNGMSANFSLDAGRIHRSLILKPFFFQGNRFHVFFLSE